MSVISMSVTSMSELEVEVWKKISNDGNNGNYEVSTLGNVRHSSTKVQKKFDIEKLKQTKTRIRFNGHYLHRLVALTFIANPNPENMKEVNHKDGNPYNNQVANLEWINRENNMKHFHANNKYACKHMRRILLIRADSNAVERTFNCLEECIAALNLNVSYSKIYAKMNNNYVRYSKKGIGGAAAGVGAVDAIYKIDENRFVKFEDNNNNLSYDIDDADADADADADNANAAAVEWVEVREAPKYMVSNTGQVKQTRLNRILKGYLINGYKSVSLKSECASGQFCRLVHRLVAEAFIANDDPVHKIYVDHIDTNIANNDRRNLRWVTPKENVNNELTKQNISIGKLKNSKRIFKIDATTKEVVTSYQNYKEVEKREPDISYKTIYSICGYYRHAMRNAMSGNLEAPSAYKNKKYDNYLFLFEDELAQMNACIELALAAVARKSVVVHQYDKDTNELIGEFETAYQASKQLNINYSGINQVINYHRYSDASRPKCYKLKTTHGFIFRENENN